MPNIITHMEYAKEVLNALPSEVKKAAEGDLRAYLLGSFGPDFLFMLNEMKRPDAGYGQFMHHVKLRPCIQKVAEYLKTNNSTVRMSYMLGFLIHYVMDKNIHPYVCHAVDTYLPNVLPKELVSTAHNHCESAIDCYILEERRPNKVNAASFDPCPEMCMKSEVLNDIATMYYDVMNKHYGHPNCPVKDLKNSFKMTKLLIWISVDRLGGKLKEICKLIEKKSEGPHRMTAFVHPPFGYKGSVDYLNHERRSFGTIYNGGTLDNTSTVEELFDNCKAQCVSVLTEFYNAVVNGGELDEANYTLDFLGEIAKDTWTEEA